MDRRKMMKKHLITCSVIMVSIIILGLTTANTSVTKTIPKPVVKASPRISHIVVVTRNTDAANDYSFANEAIPENKWVYKKMQRSINKHKYRNVQSHILHTKQYGIPNDFKYLPLVESGLREGTSPKGASGLWQFMPGTARTYGLKVGHGVDERQNIRKATIAACKYLNDLHDEFNSWTLAAAAYNNGSVKLGKAINKQSEDNYYRMRQTKKIWLRYVLCVRTTKRLDHF
jgi:membrane-bound lytic murein transglycosylase D